MNATVVGSTRIDNKGYLLFATYEPKNTAIEGSSVCTLFSKEYRAIGEAIDIFCRRTTDGFKFYERKSK